MYKRVLLKLSGESLGGDAGKGLDSASLVRYASEIVAAVKAGHQVAIVNGGGKIPTTWEWRDARKDRNRTYWVNCSLSSIQILLRAAEMKGDFYKLQD